MSDERREYCVICGSDQHHGDEHHDRTAEPPALDVERLAAALVGLSEPDWPGRIGVGIRFSGDEETDDPASVFVARLIAAEYARLAREGSDGA